MIASCRPMPPRTYQLPTILPVAVSSMPREALQAADQGDVRVDRVAGAAVVSSSS
jgi:hypothetical protein